jgi:hypothetical protein
LWVAEVGWASLPGDRALEGGEECISGEVRHQLQIYSYSSHADKQGHVGLDHRKLPPGAECQIKGSCVVHAGLMACWSMVNLGRRELTHEFGFDGSMTMTHDAGEIDLGSEVVSTENPKCDDEEENCRARVKIREVEPLHKCFSDWVIFGN